MASNRKEKPGPPLRRYPGQRLTPSICRLAAKRTDHVYKRDDYADAGVPNWIVDIDDPVSLTACRLTEEFGYVDDQTATGTFRTEVPFPFEVSLDRLV